VSGPAIPFPSASAIPILGQACTVHGWFPTVLLSCNCDSHQPLMIVGLGAIAVCPKCQRAFAIGEVMHDARTGAGSVTVSQVLTQPAAPGQPQ
jgi:hypothetical protein